ncbi:Tetratricopeptide repeat-containing protein [Ekhidna lutea]|uniref:histidine kinase n=1 Tax=Ekhidna lutea TaxID=447679 RepID=A0A239LG29_EKHLU|nr:tetratricopeptide repeat-containing sensor histidine kinase [Ekhidna lutea]SNT29431.1 Tetratricopeptide repeat-containing protein [Ekhidna lutea]
MKRNAIAFFILAYFNAFSQINSDSIRSVAENASSDSIKFSAYIQLADLSVYDEPSTSYDYAMRAYRLAVALNSPDLLSISLNRIGSSYWSAGVLDSSLFYLNKSLAQAKKIKSRSLIARNNGNIANVYAASGNYFDAVNYSKQALEEFRVLNNQNRIFAMLNNIGKYYLDNGELDSASYYLNQAGNSIKPEFEFMIPIFLFNMADLKFRQLNYFDSDSLLNVCEKKATKYQDERALIRIKQMKAELFLLNNEVDKGMKLATEAYERAVNTRVKDLIQTCAATLSKALEKGGQYKESLKILNIGLAYRDSLENRRIKNQLAIDKFNKKQLEISRLEHRNSHLVTESSYWKKIIVILSVSIFIFILLLYLIYKRRQEIKKQHQELKELNNFKNKLFAIIVHDLRAPINQLINVIQLIENGGDQPEILKMVKGKVENLNDLMNNLFGLAYEYVNEESLKIEDINLNQLIDDVIMSLSSLYEAKDIQLINQVSKKIHTKADGGLITIVLRNLIVNAIKFSHQDSSVYIIANKIHDTVEVSVIDQGVGMSEKQISRLFTTETIHSTGTKGELGSGLGLILCKEFIERNGGTIKVSSIPKEGSTFSFTLPSA